MRRANTDVAIAADDEIYGRIEIVKVALGAGALLVVCTDGVFHGTKDSGARAFSVW